MVSNIFYPSYISFIIPIIVAIAILITLWFFIKRIINKKRIIASLGMILVEITLPKEDPKEGNGEKPFKEIISAMEEFYAGMSAIRFKKSFLGPQSYFAMEIGLPVENSEIVFYAAVPKNKKQLFDKHIHALFPAARLKDIKEDYNIFKYNGKNAGSVMKLSKHPVLPIKTYDKFNSDPITTIINVFSKLKKEGEGAALQLIISSKPNHGLPQKIRSVLKKIREGESLGKALGNKSWFNMFFDVFDELLTNNSKKTKTDLPPSTPNEELIKLLEEKSARQIFNTNIRIVASSDSSERAGSILDDIESAFLQFNEPNGNSFKFKRLKGRKLRKLFFEFSFRIFNKNQIMPLNTAELTTAFHFPAQISTSPDLKFAKSSEAPPPQTTTAKDLLLGINEYRGEKSEIWTTTNDRRRHFYILGQTGTGKTNLLKNMIIQDMEAGKGVCYIDPHGSDIEDILANIPPHRREDVIYFDPADTERPMGLNLLEYDPNYSVQKTFVVNELYSIFKKLYANNPEAFGPMFEQYYRNSTILAIENNPNATLMDISRILSNKEYRDQKLAESTNETVKIFWQDIAEKTGGEASLSNIVPYITSKFDTFLSDEIMRAIIIQKKSAFDFKKIMDEGKILLVNLSKGRLGEMNANLLGLIIVGKILMASFARVDTPEELRRDFYLYIDEFQNVTTDSISTILSEARKYKLNLIIANQFIGQLEEPIRKAVFGNVGSLATFRVGAEDAKFLETQFEPTFSSRDLMNTDNYNAYLKLLVNGEPAEPFNIKTIEPKAIDAHKKDIAIKIKELSRLKYGKLKNEVK